jgi:hypothetical protein
MRLRDLVSEAAMRIRGRKHPVRVTFSAHARSPLRLQPRGVIADASEVPRALTARERDVLAALLVRPFTGRDELRQQVETARAVSGCDCGCPTISLLVDQRLPPALVKHELEPLIAYIDDATGHGQTSPQYG